MLFNPLHLSGCSEICRGCMRHLGWSCGGAEARSPSFCPPGSACFSCGTCSLKGLDFVAAEKKKTPFLGALSARRRLNSLTVCRAAEVKQPSPSLTSHAPILQGLYSTNSLGSTVQNEKVDFISSLVCLESFSHLD